MLEDTSHADVVSWSPSGDSFIVKELSAFSKECVGRDRAALTPAVYCHRPSLVQGYTMLTPSRSFKHSKGVVRAVDLI